MNWTNTQRALLALAAFACLISIAVAAWAFASWGFARAGEVSTTAGIKVTASAEVSVPRDVAHLTFGVVTRDKVAKIAVRRNAEKSTYIVAALAKQGIPKKDIKTVEFSLGAEYNYNVSPYRLTGYRASNQVKVKTRNLPKVGELIDAAMDAGANNVEGPSFDVEQKAKLREKALALAVDRAEGKARAIAKAMGASLGKPISASESLEYYPGANVSKGRARHADVALAGDGYGTQIMPGETRVTCDVTVTFTVR